MDESTYYSFHLHIYYEDTDLSGLVYHANYLKYFERAREHIIGPERLRALYYEDGVGFVVYKASMTFKEGARLGDVLEIRSRYKLESSYRVIFSQEVWREGGKGPLVDGEVQMVCVDPQGALVPLPPIVADGL